jgi:hypothetical protein
MTEEFGEYPKSYGIIETKWRVAGYRHLPAGFPASNIVVLLVNGDSHLTDIVNEKDLPALIGGEILVETMPGGTFGTPYIKTTSERI